MNEKQLSYSPWFRYEGISKWGMYCLLRIEEGKIYLTSKKKQSMII